MSAGQPVFSDDDVVDILAEYGLGAVFAYELTRYSNDPGGSPSIAEHRARGTEAAPLPIQTGDKLGSYCFRGWDGNNFENGADIAAYSGGNWNDNEHTTALVFETSANNNLQEVLVLEGTGTVRLPQYAGAASSALTIDASGTLRRGTGAVVGGNSVFGTEFRQANNAGYQSQSTSFNTVIFMTVPQVSGGKYRVAVNYNWTSDSTTSDFECRLRRADTNQILRSHRQEASDSEGSSAGIFTGTDQLHVGSFLTYLDLAGNTQPQFVFEFRSTDGSVLVSAQNVDMEFWRVS